MNYTDTNNIQSRAYEIHNHFCSQQIRIDAEIKGHLLPRATHLLQVSDIDLIREQTMLLIGALENLSDINFESVIEVIEKKPESLSIESCVEIMIDLLKQDDCWFDMALLPISDIEAKLYIKKNKPVPEFRMLVKSVDGSFKNYRFHVGELLNEMTKICHSLMDMALEPSLSEVVKEDYRKMTRAVLYMDFKTKEKNNG
jgi:hypothetical protein